MPFCKKDWKDPPGQIPRYGIGIWEAELNLVAEGFNDKGTSVFVFVFVFYCCPGDI